MNGEGEPKVRFPVENLRAKPGFVDAYLAGLMLRLDEEYRQLCEKEPT
jgi:hypothetical protein